MDVRDIRIKRGIMMNDVNMRQSERLSWGQEVHDGQGVYLFEGSGEQYHRLTFRTRCWKGMMKMVWKIRLIDAMMECILSLRLGHGPNTSSIEEVTG